MGATACVISLENMQAIASENPRFDKQEFLDWLDVHQAGYFLRDPDSVFDCKYIEAHVFHELYFFTQKDQSQLFRAIAKI